MTIPKPGKTVVIGSIMGVFVGALVILGIRFVTYKLETVHYHANFAAYINGKEQSFNGAMYFLDGGCTMSNKMTPERRAHMVQGIPGVVHVQDNAVTWGQFFENIGWYVGPDFIETSDGTMYKTDGQNKLHIIIDGQDYTRLGGITDQAIKDKDRLLLSFGNENQAVVDQQYKSVPTTAARYDGMKNASACGHTTKLTVKDRLAHLL